MSYVCCARYEMYADGDDNEAMMMLAGRGLGATLGSIVPHSSQEEGWIGHPPEDDDGDDDANDGSQNTLGPSLGASRHP